MILFFDFIDIQRVPEVNAISLGFMDFKEYVAKHLVFSVLIEYYDFYNTLYI